MTLPLALLALALHAAGGQAAVQFCHTEDCAALSTILTQNTNLSADPCDNFYEFACGGFGRRFRYDVDDPAGKAYTDASVHMTMEMENRLFEIMIDGSQVTPEDDTVRVAARLARAAFNNCVNWGEAKYSDQSPTADAALRAVAVRNFNSLLDHLIVDKARPLESLEQLLARAASMGFAPVFGLGPPEDLVNQLPADPSVPLSVNVTKMSISVNTFNYTTDVSLMLPMLKLLASKNVTLSDSLFGDLDPSPEQAMKAVASEVNRIVESLPSSNISFQGSMEELSRDLGGNATRPFRWSRFIHELMPGPTPVDSATIVAVDNLPLLKALLNYFNAEPVYRAACTPGKVNSCKLRFSRRHAFLILDALLELVDLLPLSLRDTRPAKDSPLAALIVTKPRSNRRQCLEVTHKLMEPVVEWLYRRHFFPGNFSTIERVINETKEAMIASMREQDWISAADKLKMIDKVRAMRHFVGHRELSQDQVARFYRDTAARFNRTRAADLGYVLGLALRAYARRHLDLLSSHATAPSPFHWESPFIVNAYNDLESNNLVFPLGILTPPVFNPAYPDFAIYGGLGSLAGHEIGHGFADHWFKSLEVGLLQLEPATEAGYMRRVQCVRDDFWPLDAGGNATLADDIADIVGLSAAHRAYMAGRSGATDRSPGCAGGSGRRVLSLEQMFFVHSAQVFCTKAAPEILDELFRRDLSASHSAGPVRVNGMARNSVQFARAFTCQAGSRMNPVDKCVFW